MGHCHTVHLPLGALRIPCNCVAQVVLSAAVLGESVGGHRWLAVCIGLLAVLISTRPGFAHFHAAFLLVLGCAVCSAATGVLTRMLRQTPPLVVNTYQVTPTTLHPFIPTTLYTHYHVYSWHHPPTPVYQVGPYAALLILSYLI